MGEDRRAPGPGDSCPHPLRNSRPRQGRAELSPVVALVEELCRYTSIGISARRRRRRRIPPGTYAAQLLVHLPETRTFRGNPASATRALHMSHPTYWIGLTSHAGTVRERPAANPLQPCNP
eukprot:scaffold1074_cov409-Prasinococcus_capsulatus_cf.AAC.12